MTTATKAPTLDELRARAQQAGTTTQALVAAHDAAEQDARATRVRIVENRTEIDNAADRDTARVISLRDQLARRETLVADREAEVMDLRSRIGPAAEEEFIACRAVYYVAVSRYLPLRAAVMDLKIAAAMAEGRPLEDLPETWGDPDARKLWDSMSSMKGRMSSVRAGHLTHRLGHTFDVPPGLDFEAWDTMLDGQDPKALRADGRRFAKLAEEATA